MMGLTENGSLYYVKNWNRSTQKNGAPVEDRETGDAEPDRKKRKVQ
jgi:hypothetical protein